MEQSANNARNYRTYGASRAVRWDRYTYDGPELVHVTICAADGQPFCDLRLCAQICEALVICCRDLEYRLYCYCLMPDHLHVLLSPASSGIALREWLRSVKSYTTRMYQKRFDRSRLWQRSAHDHVCRAEETAEVVARYIADNPVRAGLVQDWRDYPWTGVFIDL